MTKDKTSSASLLIKVLLKPTDIGQMLIERLQRPHVDRSGEMRRLSELGFAAERAGFTLDGTVLRHAGRTWDTREELGLVNNCGSVKRIDTPSDSSRSSPASGASIQAPLTPKLTQPELQAVETPPSANSEKNDGGSPLRQSLRKLSH